MNTSPIITKALMAARRQDMLAAARNARLVREAAAAGRGAREESPARRPVARRRWRFGLAALFGSRLLSAS